MGLQDKVERTLAAAAEGDDRAQAKAFGEVGGGTEGSAVDALNCCW